MDIPYLPMLVPPNKWKGYVGVQFFYFPASSLYIETVYDCIDSYNLLLLVLGDSNTPTIICCSYDKGGHLFLPSYIMRTHGVKDQKDAINSVPRKQLRKVFKVY